MEEIERVDNDSCEWCGCEFESYVEMERHRCQHAGDTGMGIDAPFEQTTHNYRTGKVLHLHEGKPRARTFPWERGELEGIQSRRWQSGKNK